MQRLKLEKNEVDVQARLTTKEVALELKINMDKVEAGVLKYYTR